MKLKEIESELKSLLTRERRQWTKTAQLLIEVDRNNLYKEKAKSFSQYIRHLAQEFGIHESNFWRIKKAGEYYLKLNNTDDYQVIDDAKTTPEQVEILTKISTAAPPDIVQNLEKRMVAGETTRQELRDIWKTYRPIKEGKTERGRKPKKPLNELNQQPEVEDEVEIEVDQLDQLDQSVKAVKVAKMAAANIIEALKNYKWAIDTIDTIDSIDSINSNIFHDQFHLFYEVAVASGSSRYSRRIDVVGILKEPKQALPTVIGVEIKVNINDLKRDMKLTEYIPFCHYFYLAVPNEQAMIDAAASVITPNIGILCVTDEIVDGRYQVVIIRKASLISNPNSTLLGEVYGKCLCHALGWIGEGER
jgi:hypothetical protein